jgi:hypothetical protein
MVPIKRTGKSSGGRKGKIGTSNTKARAKGPATKIKKHGAGHDSQAC